MRVRAVGNADFFRVWSSRRRAVCLSVMVSAVFGLLIWILRALLRFHRCIRLCSFFLLDKSLALRVGLCGLCDCIWVVSLLCRAYVILITLDVCP